MIWHLIATSLINIDGGESKSKLYLKLKGESKFETRLEIKIKIVQNFKGVIFI